MRWSDSWCFTQSESSWHFKSVPTRQFHYCTTRTKDQIVVASPAPSGRICAEPSCLLEQYIDIHRTVWKIILNTSDQYDKDCKILKITLRPQHWHNTVRWFKKSRTWKETSYPILKEEEEAKNDAFLSTEAWGAEAANGLLNPSLSLVLSQQFLWNELLTNWISMFDYSEFEKDLVKTYKDNFIHDQSQYLGVLVRCSHTPGGAWVVAVWKH